MKESRACRSLPYGVGMTWRPDRRETLSFSERSKRFVSLAALIERARRLGRLKAATLVLLIFSPTGPAAAESFRWYAGVSGVVKGDLDDLTLLDTSVTPAVVIADPGITLAAIGSAPTYYEVGGLPDAEAGTGDSYALAFSFEGVPYSVEWPNEAISLQPQSVRWQSEFFPSIDGLELRAGDTLPGVQAVITGLSADPSGGSATFTLLDESGTATIDGAAAVIDDVDPVVGPDGETRWRAVVSYDWQAGDTDDAGDYTYFFRVTFPGGGILTASPRADWTVRIIGP